MLLLSVYLRELCFRVPLKCADLTECGVLVYLSRTWRWGVWCTDCRVVGNQAVCRVGSVEWSWSHRERGHFFGVSHWGERPGSLPAGLTALSRNVCDCRPGWGRAAYTETKRCDPPRGLWRGVSTLQHSVCFSARLLTTLQLTVHACVCMYLEQRIEWHFLLLSFKFLYSDMANAWKNNFFFLFLFFHHISGCFSKSSKIRNKHLF